MLVNDHTELHLLSFLVGVQKNEQRGARADIFAGIATVKVDKGRFIFSSKCTVPGVHLVQLAGNVFYWRLF